MKTCSIPFLLSFIVPIWVGCNDGSTHQNESTSAPAVSKERLYGDIRGQVLLAQSDSHERVLIEVIDGVDSAISDSNGDFRIRVHLDGPVDSDLSNVNLRFSKKGYAGHEYWSRDDFG